jgi:hypothetical protein
LAIAIVTVATPLQVVAELSRRMQELVECLTHKWDVQDTTCVTRQEKDSVFLPCRLEPELRQWFSIFSVGAVACILTCCWVACTLIEAQAAASSIDEANRVSLETDVVQKLLQV